MKIITTAALAAATLVLTAAGPALADGEHGTRQAGKTSQAGQPAQPPQKVSPGSVTRPTIGTPPSFGPREDLESDVPHGILPRIMDQLL